MLGDDAIFNPRRSQPLVLFRIAIGLESPRSHPETFLGSATENIPKGADIPLSFFPFSTSEYQATVDSASLDEGLQLFSGLGVFPLSLTGGTVARSYGMIVSCPIRGAAVRR